MRPSSLTFVAAVLIPLTPLSAEEICQGFGPQTPRDISERAGLNAQNWTPAPAASELNLCNIHGHTQAEHKGPGFSLFAGTTDSGGWACNELVDLSEEDVLPVAEPHFEGVSPGDTFEVHWVFSSCQVEPGPGLGSCLSEGCANPELRVESQVFILVNDPEALNFMDYVWQENRVNGRPQPLALPSGTGDPVVFAGSTTGPKYTQSVCSPLQVTWSVRPQCTRLDINSLHEWGASHNVFEEHHAHGVRQLVTAQELLSPIN